jgi:hypothetical protein
LEQHWHRKLGFGGVDGRQRLTDRQHLKVVASWRTSLNRCSARVRSASTCTGQVVVTVWPNTLTVPTDERPLTRLRNHTQDLPSQPSVIAQAV